LTHLTLAEYAAVLIAGMIGATVQGTVGFGANLIAVPVVAIVAPEALPATLILWALPLTAAMVAREHHGVDWSGVGWMTVGRVPGTAVGAWVVATVATNTRSALCGAVVLVVVAASSWTKQVRLTPVTKTAAGLMAGIMGTATSIGGPPMALLYQHNEGRVLRSTLAMAFTVGTITSLTALALTGAIEAWQVGLALALVPALFVGLVLSRALAHRLDGPWLRPTVLAIAALAGLVAVVRGLAW
jgi:uncharacterized protein